MYEVYTVFSTTNCTINNGESFVTSVPPTCFELYMVNITKVYTKAQKYSNSVKDV